MKVLIAEDDPISHRLLEAHLSKWGYEVVSTRDGLEAWEAFQRLEEPLVAVLDWMMPGLGGTEVCRRIRSAASGLPAHIIFLTARGQEEDIVKGFEAGANDYLTKPFKIQELKARVKVGEELVTAHTQLGQRVGELEAALAKVKALEGLLPICSYCKKIRDDQDYWQEVDIYFQARSEAKFSHGICPECYETVVKPELEELRRPANPSTPVHRDGPQAP